MKIWNIVLTAQPLMDVPKHVRMIKCYAQQKLASSVAKRKRCADQDQRMTMRNTVHKQPTVQLCVSQWKSIAQEVPMTMDVKILICALKTTEISMAIYAQSIAPKTVMMNKCFVQEHEVQSMVATVLTNVKTKGLINGEKRPEIHVPDGVQEYAQITKYYVQVESTLVTAAQPKRFVERPSRILTECFVRVKNSPYTLKVRSSEKTEIEEVVFFPLPIIVLFTAEKILEKFSAPCMKMH
jgi:hypothetical protein